MTTAFPAWDPWNYRQTTGHKPGDDTNWTGFDVEATDGGIGSIDEATYTTDESYIVVDTGPWIFGKKVMLPAGVISRVDTEARKVYVDQRKEQIKNAPEYEEETRDEPEYRDKLGGYYGGYYGPGTL
jgi:hypothetical protein